MTSRAKPLDPPSPLLPPDQVLDVLTDVLGELGAAGGAIGGRIGGGFAGQVGGRSGGRLGGRLGVRLTRMRGEHRTVSAPGTPESFWALHRCLAMVVLADPGRGHLAGVIGSGALNMNPAVVQALWSPRGLELTAHAREGLIAQKTAPKALDRLEEALIGPR